MFLTDASVVFLTDMHAPAQLARPDTTPGCETCGTFKRTGKVSCCARGGSWFEKCGNVEDPQFNHTWMDGVRVCDASAGRSSSDGVVNGGVVNGGVVNAGVVNAAFAQSPHATTSSVNVTERRHVNGSQNTTSSPTPAVTESRDIDQIEGVTQAQDVTQSNQVDHGHTANSKTSLDTFFGATDSQGRAGVTQLTYLMSIIYCLSAGIYIHTYVYL